jgi:hypothetical protein
MIAESRASIAPETEATTPIAINTTPNGDKNDRKRIPLEKV